MVEPLDLVTVIQATLAPMFLITGAGIYLNFIQSRLFRAIDRIRALEVKLESGEGAEGGEAVEQPLSEEEQEAVLREMSYQLDRIRMLRNSVALGSMTMVFTALTAVLIILGFFLAGEMGLLVLTTFSVALVCLGTGLFYGLRDTYLSIRSVESGIWAEAEKEPERPGG